MGTAAAAAATVAAAVAAGAHTYTRLPRLAAFDSHDSQLGELTVCDVSKLLEASYLGAMVINNRLVKHATRSVSLQELWRAGWIALQPPESFPPRVLPPTPHPGHLHLGSQGTCRDKQVDS